MEIGSERGAKKNKKKKLKTLEDSCCINMHLNLSKAQEENHRAESLLRFLSTHV